MNRSTVLSLVVGNGVAKLPDQIFPLLFSHRRLQSIDNRNIDGFGFIVSFRGFSDQLFHSPQVIPQLLRLLFVLLCATGIAASFGPFAHSCCGNSVRSILLLYASLEGEAEKRIEFRVN